MKFRRFLIIFVLLLAAGCAAPPRPEAFNEMMTQTARAELASKVTPQAARLSTFTTAPRATATLTPVPLSRPGRGSSLLTQIPKPAEPQPAWNEQGLAFEFGPRQCPLVRRDETRQRPAPRRNLGLDGRYLAAASAHNRAQSAQRPQSGL